MKEKIKNLAGKLGLYLSSYSNRARVADAMETCMLAAPLVATAAIASCDPKDVFGAYSSIADFFNLHTISDVAEFLKASAIDSTGSKGELIHRLAAAMPIGISAYASALSLEGAVSRRVNKIVDSLMEYSRKVYTDRRI